MGLDVRMSKAKEENDNWKKQRKEYREQKKEREAEKLAEEQTAGMDPGMMAMMGFGGFK